MYDLIGDIHGHLDQLERLLAQLGYQRTAGFYSHPSRQVIFLGDFIDRGPAIQGVLDLAKAMVDGGSALAILGNHELNALAFHTPSPVRPGQFLRLRTVKNLRQHQQTIDQIPANDLAKYLDWFRTLPMWLDLPGLRAVHACWNDLAIAEIQRSLTRYDGLSDAFLAEAYSEETPLYRATEIVLRGPEADLPHGISYFDKDGHERHTMRIRWFLPPADHTYRSYGLQADEIACDLPIAAELIAATQSYPLDAKPVFIGHYWLQANHPALLTPNVACLDYSVAKGGFLTAYRWDGETTLMNEKFVLSF